MKEQEFTQSNKQVLPFRSNQEDPIPSISSKRNSLNKYLKAAKEEDPLTLLRSEMTSLRKAMMREIELLKHRVLVMEEKGLNIKQAIDKNHQFEDLVGENIDEEYKSKKRHIHELSIHVEPPPTVKLNLKHLGQQESFQKQIITDLKREIKEQSNLQEPSIANSKSKQQTAKSSSKDRVGQQKRPVTSLKLPKNQGKSQISQLSPSLKAQDESELQATLKNGINKANTPLESPFRGNKTPIEKSNGQSFTGAVSLTERLRLTNASNHKDSIRLADLNKSTLNSKNDVIHKTESNQLLQALVESPKFLQYVNSSNTGRQASKTQLGSYTQPISQKVFKLLPESTKQQATQNNHQEATNQELMIFDDDLQITDRAPSNLSINDRILLNSGKIPSQARTQRQLKNPLIKNYINNKPQTMANADSDEESEVSLQSDECDEKRSYTPEPRNLDKLGQKFDKADPARGLNRSMIGAKSSLNTSMSAFIAAPLYQGGVNSVYKSTKMELSKYISKNKSVIDHQQTSVAYLDTAMGFKAIIENKGSKCNCIKTQGQLLEPSKTQCGDYCKNLGSKDQKRIILECLVKDQQDIRSNKKIKRYLIDAKWMRKWCDYTNFDTNLFSSITLEEAIEFLDDFMNSSDQQETLRTNRYDSSQLYQRPSKILNESLIDTGHRGNQKRLRDNLVENFDFVIVSPLIWTHQYSWYSADCQVVRYLVRDKFNKKQYLLDLYPHHKQDKMNLSYMGPQQQSSDESESESQDQDNSPQLRTKSSNNNAFATFNQLGVQKK